MSLDVYMEFHDIVPWRAPLTCHLTLYWKKVIKCHTYIKLHVFRACHRKMPLNSTCTSNDMFLRASHGKMPLNATYTSNEFFLFRVVSRENVIEFHIHIKLHVCLGACHRKMPYIHQITCFLGRVTENAIYIHKINCFLGACHGKMSFNAICISNYMFV